MSKKIRFIISLIITISIAIASFSAVAIGASGPEVVGKESYLYLETTDEVLWEDDINKKTNIASITKLMTCLIAIEKLGLDHVVTVDKEATNIKKYKSYVYEGEKITVKDLVHEAMLVSANDAAKALAIAVSGSEKKFVKLMNERAKKIGCTNTNFLNASGVYVSNKGYSTARDVALIAMEALKNKELKKIAGTTKYTVGKTNKSAERKLESGNLFLYGGNAEIPSGKVKVEKYEGVFGGKTGTTNTNKANMVVGCEIDGFTVYAVILDSSLEERYNDIKKLLNYAKDNISRYEAFQKGDEFGQASLKGGAKNKVTAIAQETGLMNLPEGASAALVTTKTVYADDLVAPINKGDKIGIIEIYLADELVRTIPLIANEEVKEGWFLSAFGITNFQTIIIILIFAIIVCLALLIIVLRTINKRKRERARQARLREMARRQLENEHNRKIRDWPY